MAAVAAVAAVARWRRVAAAMAGAAIGLRRARFDLTCLNFLPCSESTVSTMNSDEKMLVSLAPYPFRPPVTFFWLSL